MLASSLNAFAIGFVAEDVYKSVFLVFSGDSLGSGFAIGENCILTNAHVVGNPGTVMIKSYSGEEYNAFVAGIDYERDLALLGVEGGEFAHLEIKDVAEVKTGDDVYAIGAPKSMAYTLTKGVISAKERELDGSSYIQIDAPVNHGNSGGPVLDDEGKVLGITTLKLSDSEGIGLAIPMKTVTEFLAELNVSPDENGIISVEEKKEEAAEEKATEKENPRTVPTAEKENSTLTTVLIISLAVSVVGNIIFLILLMYQRKKNINFKYDPRERTDFDIDVLE